MNVVVRSRPLALVLAAALIAPATASTASATSTATTSALRASPVETTSTATNSPPATASAPSDAQPKNRVRARGLGSGHRVSLRAGAERVLSSGIGARRRCGCVGPTSYGKEHDALTSLSYYGYRFYDRLTLTWTQADPLYRFVPDLAWDEPRRANLYSFSLNNPLRYIDPDGRDSCNGRPDCKWIEHGGSGKDRTRGADKKKSGAGQEAEGSEGEVGDEAGGGSDDGVTGKRKLGRHNGGKKGGIERGTVGGAEEVDLPGGGERGLVRIPVTPETEQAVSGLMIVLTVVQAGVGAVKGAMAAVQSVRGASTALGKSIKSLKGTLQSGKGPWKLMSAHAEPAKSITKKLRGGTSVEQVFVHQETGERIYRHFITNNGEIYHEKFRDYTHFGE